MTNRSNSLTPANGWRSPPVRSSHGHAPADVADTLRRLVREGELRSGEHLRQDNIARQLDVTRVPVREAFKTLVAEGLLVHRPNQGHFVATLDADELRQIYWMRNVLEREIARTMILPNNAALKRARQANETMKQRIERGPREVASYNRLFHFTLFDLSPKAFVVQEVRALWDRTDQYRALYLYREGVALRACADHVAMLAALERNDIRRYTGLLREHRSTSERAVIEELEHVPRDA